MKRARARFRSCWSQLHFGLQFDSAKLTNFLRLYFCNRFSFKSSAVARSCKRDSYKQNVSVIFTLLYNTVYSIIGLVKKHIWLDLALSIFADAATPRTKQLLWRPNHNDKLRKNIDWMYPAHLYIPSPRWRLGQQDSVKNSKKLK